MKKASYCAILLLFALFLNCNGSKVKQPELEKWDDFRVEQFKKEKTIISGSFHFYNPNPFSVMLLATDFDVYVNNVDVGSFIDKQIREVKAEQSVSIPINFEFNPNICFDNLDKGVLKIKSDHVAPVRFAGKLTIKTVDKEEDKEYDVTQTVLFSNNNKLYLDENDEIVY